MDILNSGLHFRFGGILCEGNQMYLNDPFETSLILVLWMEKLKFSEQILNL